MISWLRLFLNVASGITSVLVYVTLIIEFIFLLSMVTFDRLVDIHYSTIKSLWVPSFNVRVFVAVSHNGIQWDSVI